MPWIKLSGESCVQNSVHESHSETCKYNIKTDFNSQKIMFLLDVFVFTIGTRRLITFLNSSLQGKKTKIGIFFSSSRRTSFTGGRFIFIDTLEFNFCLLFYFEKKKKKVH